MVRRIQRMFSLLSQRLRMYWLSLVPVSVVEAILESIGAVAIFSLIKILDNPDSIYTIPVVSQLFETLDIKGNSSIVLSFTIMVTFFYILKNTFLLVSAYLRSSVTSTTIKFLSSELFSRYLKAPFTFHFQRNSASMIDRTIRGADDAVRLVLEAAVACISEILVLSGIIIILVIAAPVMTLVSLAIIVFLLGTLLYVTHSKFYRLGAEHQKLRIKSQQAVQQALGGIKEVKVMGREQYWKSLFSSYQQGISSIRKWYATLHAAPRFLVETVFICIPLVMVILTRNKAVYGHSILPLLGLYAYAGFRAIPSFNRITMHLNNIRYGGAVADLLYDDFTLLGVAQDRSHQENVDQHLSFEQSLSAEHVCFSYDEKTGHVLNDLTLTIKRGEYIAIAGATGAGKSTIIDIILGLIPPSSGKITVDGVDISNKVSAWRKKIGYVPQDIYLTDDTLRRNIAFGIPDEEISENKVIEALRLAQLGNFVPSLPKGLDTVIGERGVTLSGGEKQRVAVARALYLNPEILIFDEATSALDSRTEQELADAIRSLRGHTTIILVAHRIQTIKNCDRIIFIRNGRIEATGRWDELLQNSPEFCKLVNV